MYSKRKQKHTRVLWNKGRLMRQKPPLALQEDWAIRTRLQDPGNLRNLALFNLAIDSKLRASDLLRLRVSEVASDGHVYSRATVSQKKTRRPERQISTL